MILNLLLIMMIDTLIVTTGFFDNVEDFIRRRVRFFRLPHIFKCSLCQTWWLCILYLILSHNISLLGVFLSICVAFFSDVFEAFVGLLKGLILYLLEKITNKIDY